MLFLLIPITLFSIDSDKERNFSINLSIGGQGSSIRDKSLSQVVYKGTDFPIILDLEYSNKHINIPVALKYTSGHYDNNKEIILLDSSIKSEMFYGSIGLLFNVFNTKKINTYAGLLIDALVYHNRQLIGNEIYNVERLRVGFAPGINGKYEINSDLILSFFSYIPLINYSINPDWDYTYTNWSNVYSNGEYLTLDKSLNIFSHISCTYLLSPLIQVSSGISFNYQRNIHQNGIDKANFSGFVGLGCRF